MLLKINHTILYRNIYTIRNCSILYNVQSQLRMHFHYYYIKCYIIKIEMRC